MTPTLLAERRKPSGECRINGAKLEGSRPSAIKAKSKVSAIWREPSGQWFGARLYGIESVYSRSGSEILGRGVMVAQQTLTLFVKVRVLTPQLSFILQIAPTKQRFACISSLCLNAQKTWAMH